MVPVATSVHACPWVVGFAVSQRIQQRVELRACCGRQAASKYLANPESEEIKDSSALSYCWTRSQAGASPKIQSGQHRLGKTLGWIGNFPTPERLLARLPQIVQMRQDEPCSEPVTYKRRNREQAYILMPEVKGLCLFPRPCFHAQALKLISTTCFFVSTHTPRRTCRCQKKRKKNSSARQKKLRRQYEAFRTTS